jgi:hypothetical protein
MTRWPVVIGVAALTVTFGPIVLMFLAAGVIPQPAAAAQSVNCSTAYVNPFSKIADLAPERIDQGVDFGGAGPILAVGNGTLLQSAIGTGWGPSGGGIAPGMWLTYKLTDGPLQGQVVYVAEGANPLVTKPGEIITAGEHIADMVGGIEIGWANATTAQVKNYELAPGATAASQTQPFGSIFG